LIAAADGAGAGTLGIVLAARACSKRKSLVVVDTEKQVYFPAAVRFGLELSRSIVVRPSSVRDAYQAIVQSLRSSAVGVVLGWQQWMSTRQLRCLHLAADAGGGLIILVRQAAALRNPSCAAVRLLVSPVACTGSRYANHLDGPSLGRFVRPSDRPGMRHIRVEVLRCRGRAQGESRVLEIDDETGHVHTLAAVATATALARPARAS
jgi:hypothetical protein